MRHPGLVEFFTQEEQFKELLGKVDTFSLVKAHGLEGAHKHLVMSLLGYCASLPLLVITSKEDLAKSIAQDAGVLFPSKGVEYFPVREILPAETYAQSREVVSQRVGILTKLRRGELRCVIATPEALSRRLCPPAVFEKMFVRLETGQSFSRDNLVLRLVQMGYERVEVVEIPGQFAVRGGIMDIFGVNSFQPVRIEFFGDDIDTLRTFDPHTQRSKDNVPEVAFPPAVEFTLDPDDPVRQKGILLLEEDLKLSLKHLEEQGRNSSVSNLEDKIAQALQEMHNGIAPYHLEQYLPYFVKEQVTLLDYFPGKPLVIVDEPDRVQQAAFEREEDLRDIFRSLLEEGKALPRQEEISLSNASLQERLAGHKQVQFSLLPKSRSNNEDVTVGLSGRELPVFQGKFPMLAAQVKEWRRQKYAVVVMTSSKERGQRLKEGFWDNKIEAALIPEIRTAPVPGQVMVTFGKPSSGFELPGGKLVLVSDKEIFGRSKLRQPRKQFDQGLRISDFSEIRPGDYIVHAQHGIGKYLGVINLEVQGIRKDYLHIQYFGQDKLYVPTDSIHLVNKYVGSEGHKPKLHKLGSSDWTKAKNRVKESVKELAKELLNLYAARETVQGYAFAPDTAWQAEFEEGFPFAETPDQLKAIGQIKGDMEKSKPMDRLLVGDVGYGKTEVALRAAFKALMDNKQVAVLVPTTVLAQQHLRTFTERFKGIPAKVEVLSRLRTAGEQKKTVEKLAEGGLDIVIGTHRLLSKDVRFKDLGLLIIDEEQRFGVAHKERLKKMRQSVDVLTLTATPIPRTLHMALAGARDMSVINTPPENRYPVQTYVVEYSKELVAEAMRRELDRGGQVFYVHNLVNGLERLAVDLQQMLPEARIAVGHGQMPEKKLDKVMVDFVEGNIDVLVCTTIVENGLDIGNVNTLIVDHADRFGLSQLYQLRGRVGRSSRIAYAYFTYDNRRILGDVAEKRLNAIREFTEFGSGFKLAMRDLEIRGAGNLLGSEQHGHMLDVGFDLYCQLLEGAVRVLKGQPEQQQKAPPEVEIELNLSAYVGDGYIQEPALKLDVYHRLRDISTPEELSDFRGEMEDRFGALPEEVQNLFLMVEMRILAQGLGAKAVRETPREVKITFEEKTIVKGDMLMVLARDYPRQLSFSSVGGLEIKVTKQNLSGPQLGGRILEILYRIKELVG